MRINRLVGFAVTTLLVVGVMGAISLKVFAKGNPALIAQVTQAADCSQDQVNDTETKDAGSDNDNVDLQCGDQNSPDSQADAGEVYTDTTGVQQGDQISAGELYTETTEVKDGNQSDAEGKETTGADTEGTHDAETNPTGNPVITSEQAQAAALAAHPGRTVIKTELDNENSQLIYSVELDGGLDVKVDAMTGAIMATDTGED
jgi:uncharacterized membrane protein YkoI